MTHFSVHAFNFVLEKKIPFKQIFLRISLLCLSVNVNCGIGLGGNAVWCVILVFTSSGQNNTKYNICNENYPSPIHTHTPSVHFSSWLMSQNDSYSFLSANQALTHNAYLQLQAINSVNWLWGVNANLQKGKEAWSRLLRNFCLN